MVSVCLRIGYAQANGTVMMMNDTFDYQRVTSEEVFVLYRSLCGKSPYSYPSLLNGELTATTTIEDWDCCWNLFDATFGSGERHFANYWNEWWGVDIPWSEWSPILRNPANHTVADVCKLIAKYARRPVAREVTILGRRCASAGMFLAIRSLLTTAGASEASIGPSTELAEYSRRYFNTFDRQIRLLAPNRLPHPQIVRNVIARFFEWIVFGCIIGCASCMIFALAHPVRPMPAVIAAFVLTSFILIAGIAAIISKDAIPESVAFGDLRTFRDLTKCLVGKKSASMQN